MAWEYVAIRPGSESQHYYETSDGHEFKVRVTKEDKIIFSYQHPAEGAFTGCHTVKISGGKTTVEIAAGSSMTRKALLRACRRKMKEAWKPENFNNTKAHKKIAGMKDYFLQQLT